MRLVATAALALVIGLAVLVPGTARAGSLYSGSGPRPGPYLLYDPAPPTPPPLQNAGIWKASPILVSGASSYRSGEFVYQDYLYDDHGAAEAPDPGDPRTAGNAFSKPNGTYTYPTDAAYANDAADLVEFRVRPLVDATAFRITLNTLKDPSLIALSVAIGGTPGVSLPFPDGANVRAPADLFLTVHPAGSTLVGELVHAATGTPVAGPAPTVTLDRVRRQIEVRIHHSTWNPGGQVVRLAAGVGLWDKAANRYLLPQGAADATHPGGAGSSVAPPGFFNLAFRNSEPVPAINDPAGTAVSPAWWRDRDQGTALAAGDITGLHADVDFAKLAAGTADDSGVPQTGPIDRILASRVETAQGADFSVVCLTSAAKCNGQYQGGLQPYAIYVPRKPAPAQGYGLTLLLHSLSTNYNQYLGSHNQSQFGERGPGSIVVTTESRGPDGSYTSLAGTDVFEVWADVARRYRLDPAWTAITGYSMGGIGTFKLGEQFPDLFARAQPTVGDSASSNMIASLRNVPVLMWNMAVDELVPPASYLPTAVQLDNLGYRYELDVFAPGEHNTLAINDQYAPAAAFLGTAKVDRDPAHVTYVIDPKLDYPKLGFVADHAYWLSGLQLRDHTPGVSVNPIGNDGDPQGTIDVLSHGFGIGDPTPSPTQAGSGTLTGGTVPTIAFTRQFRTWGAAPQIAQADQLDIKARNVRTVTIDAPRARVTCSAKLVVNSDGPVDVRLTGCALAPSACRLSGRLSLPLIVPRRGRVVRADAYVNGRHVKTVRGRRLKRIGLRGLPRTGFRLRIVTHTSTGAGASTIRVYRACGCRVARRLTLRTRVRGGHVVRADAYVNGRHVKTVRGANVRSITLTRLPRRGYTIRVMMRTARGARSTFTRRYACRTKRSKRHRPR